MSLKTSNETKRIRMEEERADKDRAQREHESKRQAKVDLTKSAISAVSTVAGGIVKGAAKSGAKGATKYVFNHPEWYKKFISDIRVVASIPTFRFRHEKSFGVNGYYMADSDLPSYTYPNILTPESLAHQLELEEVEIGGTLPSVLALLFMPHLGKRTELGYGPDQATYKRANPINQTLWMDVTNLGKINSRLVNPDISVPGMYLTAVVDVYAFLEELHFVIDAAVLFSNNDYSISEAILRGKGWDMRFIRDNIAEIRKLYDILTGYVQSALPIPADLALLSRRLWLAHTMIKDTKTDKASYILFRQEAYGMYSPESNIIFYDFAVNTYSGTGGVRGAKSIAAIEEYFRDAVRNILRDDEMVTFVSNLRAAVPEDRFYKCASRDVSVVNLELMNDDTRQQMQNVITLPYDVSVADNNTKANESHFWRCFDVYADSDGNMYNKEFITGAPVTYDPAKAAKACAADAQVAISKMGVFNTFKADLTDDDMLTMTRLHPLYSFQYNKLIGEELYRPSVILNACGTEIVTKAYLVRSYATSGGGGVSGSYVTSGWCGSSRPDINSTVYYEHNETVANALACDGVFQLSIFGYDDEGNWNVSPAVEWDNNFLIPFDTLSRIHEVCIRSEYYLDDKLYSKSLIR